jgi:hypothetical protein
VSLKSKCDQYDTLVKELFRILDVTEESDEGRVSRPVRVVCHRSYLLQELEEVLSLLKLTMEDKA